MRSLDEIRKELKSFSSFVPLDVAEKLRGELRYAGAVEYEQKNHNAEYLVYLNENNCTFSFPHIQSTAPFCTAMFSVKSQHVCGVCVEECLDKALSY
jgi:ferredoxin